MKQGKIKIIMPSSNKKKKNRNQDISLTRRENKKLYEINYRRNEAIGIILLGLGIFTFTFFYYMNTAKANFISNKLVIYIGLGVYILPIFISILGMQIFMNKTYGNILSRVLGILVFILACLGFLNQEGGKIGNIIYNNLNIYFGNFPTKILLFFTCISSLIYALDILYKDFIKYLIIIVEVVFKLLLFVWEGTIFLTANFINIIDITIKGIFIIYYRIKNILNEFYTEKTIEENNLYKYISNLITFSNKSNFFETSGGNKLDLKPNLICLSSNISSNQICSLIEKDNDINYSQNESANMPNKNETTINRSQNTLNDSNLDNKKNFNSNINYVPFPNNLNTQVTEKDNLSHNLCNDIGNLTNTNSMFPDKNVIKASECQNNESVSINSTTSLVSNFFQSPCIVKSNSDIQQCNYNEKNIDSEVTINKATNSYKIEEEYTVSSFSKDKEAKQKIDDVSIEKLETKPYDLDKNTIDKDIIEENNKNSFEGQKSSDYKNNSDDRKPKLPPIDLLKVPPPKEEIQENDLKERSELLLKTFEEFGIKAQITDIVIGPAVSRFEIRPAPGIKVSKITSLVNEIAMALAAPAIRIEAPIPGKSAVGIEIPNPKPTPVYFYELVKNENFRSSKTLLNLALGMSINRRPVYADLAEMPHLLIAGATGAGKSVCINTIIASILYQATAEQVKMVMIDPKMVELSGYNGIPHLISPVVTDPKKAANALQWAVEEMLRRYEFLSSVKSRNINDYNQELPRLRKEYSEDLKPMPLIVIIIDELADLMMTSSAQVESAICRLSQMSRAVGIHLVIATQRPSVDVITGLIKANLPSRIAFYVTSQIDSRTILDEKGAEKLLGKGDMLFKFKGRPLPIRIQGAYISDQELRAITEFVKEQGQPEYIDIEPIGKDINDLDHQTENQENDDSNSDSDSELINKVLEYLQTQEKTSTSMLQRKFKIGYNRAARIMDILEEKGIVSPQDGSNKRKVLKRSI